ncbi:hypothetical protein ACK399_05495 [Aeromonas veronii]
MSNFITRQIQITKITHNIQGLIYAIDTPRNEEVRIFNSSMLKVSGWVLFDNKPVDVIICSAETESNHSCQIIRNDVISLLKRDADAKCGFIIPITNPVDFKIGFKIHGVVVWVADIKIKLASKVLFGRDGYLFLDNDTNKSVEQYIGKELMSKECLSLWQEYFIKLDSASKKLNFKYVFTLAPAKELVYPTLYPYIKSSITPVEQFLIGCDGNNIFYPLNELREVGESSYWKLDTHWTDYGAGIVVNSILKSFDIENKNPFPFPFNIKKLNGDLGSKLPKLTVQDIMIADFSASKKMRVFDNKIINRGWIQVYENKKSPNQEKVIVFGDSFSVNMIPYLVNTFGKVIHVLSGARIDYELVNYEKPDYVICEITTRFLIQSPDIDYSVSDDCDRKIESMTLSERASYIKGLISEQNKDSEYEFYLNKTLGNSEKEVTYNAV